MRNFVDAFAGYDAVVDAVRLVRRARPGTSTRIVARRSGDPALADGGRARPSPRTYELSEFLVDVLGVTDVGAYFPHRVTYHPTCHSLRMLGRRRPAAAAARGGPRPAAGRPPARRGVLRLRRHLRGEERRHLGRDGRRQGPARARDRRRGAGRRRQLLPDAHRRPAVAPAGRACGSCTSPRSSPRPRATPEARDDRHLRRHAAVPDRGARGAGRHPAAPQPRPRHRARSAPSAAQVVAEVEDWEELRLAGAAVKDHALRDLDDHLLRSSRSR